MYISWPEICCIDDFYSCFVLNAMRTWTDLCCIYGTAAHIRKDPTIQESIQFILLKSAFDCCLQGTTGMQVRSAAAQDVDKFNYLKCFTYRKCTFIFSGLLIVHK